MPVRTGTYRYVLGRRHVIISYTQAVIRVWELNSTVYMSYARDMIGWNRISKNAKFRSCMYILVRTVTYWYVQEHTWKKTCDYLIHPDSDLRVKFDSASGIQYSSIYRYIPVYTGIYYAMVYHGIWFTSKVYTSIYWYILFLEFQKKYIPVYTSICISWKYILVNTSI